MTNLTSQIGRQLRRVYVELVRRRAKVRVVPAVEPALSCRPIFVVGIYRSGTTLLRLVLDSHSAIACPPESEFLSKLHALIDDERSLSGWQSLGFDRSHVIQRARHFASYFFEGYASSQGKTRWADKTPRYVEHLDGIDELFPSAQYIVIHRYPLDQIHSLVGDGTRVDDQVKLPGESTADARIAAAHYWRETTGRILEFVAAHRDQCIEIRYEDLCDAPEETMRRVFGFLEEKWEPGVLEYYRYPHDAGFESGRPYGNRGFAASRDHYRRWDQDVIDQCTDVVREGMAQVGYAPRT